MDFRIRRNLMSLHQSRFIKTWRLLEGRFKSRRALAHQAIRALLTCIPGKLVWRFHSVPHPGEVGNDTWEGDSWKNRSGTNVWGLTSVDLEHGLIFLPFGSPAFDFYAADRKGKNLFGNSLVALDASTGKLAWYFQIVHHDTWDYDLESAPVLMDVVRDGNKIPAVAIIGKNGLLFILDRRDGKPIYGVEERPIPPSEIPGEASWPTEPFPLKPPPLGTQQLQSR